MASVQDLESRMRVVEDKVDFIMRTMAMTVPSRLVGGRDQRLTLLDLYQEVKAALGPREVGDGK